MLRTLRIASIVMAAAAAGVVVLVAVFGLKGDPGIEAYLAEEGVIAKYKAKAGEVTVKEDAVSPLVTQAKALALRLDPPPPPRPVEPVKPTPRPAEVASERRTTPAPNVTPPPPPSAKVTLVGTAVYPEHPEKSLVLFRDVRNESKWYRQGDAVGRQVIQEVRDGSVVMFQNGQQSEELFVNKPATVKSLLKGDSAGEMPGGPSVTSAASVTSATTSTVMPPEMPTASPGGRPIPNRTVSPDRVVNTAERYRRVSELSPGQPSESRRMRTPPPVQTPEEQMESLEQSIASIQEIMTHEATGGSAEEMAQNEAMFKSLIDILEAEKQNLQPGETPAAVESAEEVPVAAGEADEAPSSD